MPLSLPPHVKFSTCHCPAISFYAKVLIISLWEISLCKIPANCKAIFLKADTISYQGSCCGDNLMRYHYILDQFQDKQPNGLGKERVIDDKSRKVKETRCLPQRRPVKWEKPNPTWDDTFTHHTDTGAIYNGRRQTLVRCLSIGQ